MCCFAKSFYKKQAFLLNPLLVDFLFYEIVFLREAHALSIVYKSTSKPKATACLRQKFKRFSVFLLLQLLYARWKKGDCVSSVGQSLKQTENLILEEYEILKR